MIYSRYRKRRTTKYPRKYRKTYKRYRRYSKSGISRRNLTVQRGLITSKSQLVKFRYCENTTLPSTSLIGLSNTAFWCNGMYDPDFTGGGHQPKGFDQWAAFYNHYVVIGSKIHVKFTSADNSVGSGGIVGILVSDSSATGYTTGTQFIEDPKTHYAHISPVGGSRDMVSVTHKFSTKSFFGVSNPVNDIPNYGGNLASTGGSNPGEGAYYYIFYQSDTGTTETAPYIVVTIEYIAILNGPVNISSS